MRSRRLSKERLIQRLEDVLDRQRAIPSLSALRQALNERGASTSATSPLEGTAFGLDTNVVLAMARGDSKTIDLRDYLDASRKAILILPGQVVQEFWNNTVSVVDTVSVALKRKFDDLEKEISRTGISGDFQERFRSLMSEFEEQYGYVYDPKTMERFSVLFAFLEDSALVSYVPRSRFQRLVSVRNSTKTPPGFKDSGDGDFFVWADFLFGLQCARAGGRDFDRAVFVTEDVKADWSSGGNAHPILVAEVQALLGIPFETWTIAKFNGTLKDG